MVHVTHSMLHISLKAISSPSLVTGTCLSCISVSWMLDFLLFKVVSISKLGSHGPRSLKHESTTSTNYSVYVSLLYLSSLLCPLAWKK